MGDGSANWRRAAANGATPPRWQQTASGQVEGAPELQVRRRVGVNVWTHDSKCARSLKDFAVPIEFIEIHLQFDSVIGHLEDKDKSGLFHLTWQGGQKLGSLRLRTTSENIWESPAGLRGQVCALSIADRFLTHECVECAEPVAVPWMSVLYSTALVKSSLHWSQYRGLGGKKRRKAGKKARRKQHRTNGLTLWAAWIRDSWSQTALNLWLREESVGFVTEDGDHRESMCQTRRLFLLRSLRCSARRGSARLTSRRLVAGVAGAWKSVQWATFAVSRDSCVSSVARTREWSHETVMVRFSNGPFFFEGRILLSRRNPITYVLPLYPMIEHFTM